MAGWPDRNPPIEDGVTDPTHHRGVLIFPQHNFTVCYPPQAGDRDYKVCIDPAANGERSWVRYFNVGTDGDSKVDIYLDGITLDLFAWSPPDVGSKRMAILIKVPGQTTWMDIGRRDGDGPSKQDPFADGAGCMIVGPETANLTPDTHVGTQRCRVRCNLGPSAALYNDTSGQPQLLMKVIMRRSQYMDLNLEQGGPDGTVKDIRGLIGVSVEGVR